MVFPSISPTLAEVLLLSLTLALGFFIGWAVGSSQTPEPPFFPFLTVSGFGENSTELTIKHLYGGTIKKAFDLENGAIVWRNLEVRINALKVTVKEGGKLNGRMDGGRCDFKAGDVLSFPLGGLRKGDELLLVYVPQGIPLYKSVLE
ncbi:MAG: hypothetical protein QXG22_00035 [Candidatus Hadarchaeales archaeon]